MKLLSFSAPLAVGVTLAIGALGGGAAQAEGAGEVTVTADVQLAVTAPGNDWPWMPPRVQPGVGVEVEAGISTVGDNDWPWGKRPHLQSQVKLAVAASGDCADNDWPWIILPSPGHH